MGSSANHGRARRGCRPHRPRRLGRPRRPRRPARDAAGARRRGRPALPHLPPRRRAAEEPAGRRQAASCSVDGGTFEKSVHTGIGCAGCHGDIELGNHPPSRKDIKSARDYALAATEACRGCHDDKFKEWEGSVHGALARDGNVRAPLCTGCHNPHGVIKGAAATLEGMPCQRCHQDIAKAYLGSVHAQARQKPETSYAPLCSGCHGAHEIKPVVSDAGPRSACVGCHAEVQEKHHAWLPNAGLHLDVVTCPACHVPGAQRQVDLMIYDNQSKAQVAEQQRRSGVRAAPERRPGRRDARRAGAVADADRPQPQGQSRQGHAARPARGAHRAGGAPARRQEQGAEQLQRLPPRRIGRVPERDDLDRRAGRPAHPPGGEPGRAHLGDLHRLGGRVLRDRRNPHRAARHPDRPRLPGRRRLRGRPREHAVVLQALSAGQSRARRQRPHRRPGARGRRQAA